MSKAKRYFLILPILCIALIPCTSVFVSAVTNVIDIPLNEPLVSDNAGYVVLICEYNDTGTYFPIVYSWFGASQIDADSSFYFDIHVTKSNIKFTSKSTGSVSYFFNIREYPGRASSGKLGNYYSYMTNTGSVWERSYTYEVDLTDCTIWKIIPAGNYGVITSDTHASTSREFTLNWSDSYYDEFYDTINALLISIGEMQLTNEELTKIFDILSLINNNLDLTNEQLEETYTLLSEYLKAIEKDTTGLVGLFNQLYDEWYNWTYVEEEYYLRIIELLEQLIEGTEKFTESSTLSDEQNELNRVEDELLNNEDASNAQDDIKVEVNENALSFIWDLISQFLNINSKLFGIFVSVLSLGIIALILNR